MVIGQGEKAKERKDRRQSVLASGFKGGKEVANNHDHRDGQDDVRLSIWLQRGHYYCQRGCK